MSFIWSNIWAFWLEVVVVVGLSSVSLLLLFGPFLGSMAETDGHNSVGVCWVASTGVLVYLWWFLVWVYLGCEYFLM